VTAFTKARTAVGVVGLLSVLTCSEHSCPTIACSPEIAVAFRTALPSPYTLDVSVHGSAFSSECPKAPPQLGTLGFVGISACDEDGFTVTGVDLGRGENATVDLAASLNGATPIAVTTSLKGISNSRDCDIICFRHSGTLPN
jgi:hypothetical protein